MTPAELAAIRERAQAATPGPWKPTQEPLTHPSGYEIESPEEYIAIECCGYTGSIAYEPDAVFISHAREDIPALLDHIDDLTKQLTIKSESSALIRDSLRDLLEKLDTRLAAALALHTPVGWPDQYCQHCEHNYPCPTQRAANGDPPEPHVPYLDTN